MSVSLIVDKFYEDPNIASIYVYEDKERKDIHLLLWFIDETVKNLALGFARTQNQASREFPDLNIEIEYIPIKYFNNWWITEDEIYHPRKNNMSKGVGINESL